MVVRDADRLRTALDAWTLDRNVGVSFETTGRQPWEPGAALVGVSVCGIRRGDGVLAAIYVPLAHRRGNAAPDVWPTLLEWLHRAKLVCFALSAKALWAAHVGVPLTWVGDGYLLARLLQTRERGLKELAASVLRKPVIAFSDVVPTGTDFSVTDPDNPHVQQYATESVLNAWRVEQVLRAKLPAPQLPVYRMEIDAAVVLARQTLQDYAVDEAVLKAATLHESQAIIAHETAVFSLFGGPINVQSSVQLEAAFKARGITSPITTASGRPSWALDALQLLERRHPEAAAVARWREAYSALRGLHQLAPVGGRLHPYWRSIGETGSPRVSSVYPDMLKLPTSARRALIAPPGHVWVTATYEEPDLRWLAQLSGDTALQALLVEHTCYPYTGLSEMLGVASDDAKRIALGWIASAEPEYLSLRSGLPPEVCLKAAATMKATFPKAAAYLIRCRQFVAAGTPLTSWGGRTYRAFTTHEGEDQARLAGPAVIQHSSATAVKLALLVFMAGGDVPAIPLPTGLSALVPEARAIDVCDALATALRGIAVRMPVTSRAEPQWS